MTLPNVSTNALEKVIKYCKFHVLHDCEYHAQISKEEDENEYARRRREEEERHESDRGRVDVNKWDYELVMKMDTCTLCEFIVACEYLNLHELRDLAGKCCGEKIKEKTIMTLFHNTRKNLSFPILMDKNIEWWH
jgi:hypothetical protein